MSNAINKDLEGKVVLIADGGLFKCETGFGCKPTTNGRRIYGHYLTNEQVKMYDGQIFGDEVVAIINKDCKIETSNGWCSLTRSLKV